MNHFRQYKKLITKAKERGAGEENHHIFPVSIFGDNEKTVRLTMREHWIAHKLLFHICINRYGNHSNTYKMSNAVRIMGNRTAREYQSAREYFVQNHHTKTPAGRKAISQRMIGPSNPMFGNKPHNYGKKASAELVEKNSKGHKCTYELTFLNGNKMIVVGMKQFALENGYNHGHLIQIGKRNRERHKDVIGVIKL